MKILVANLGSTSFKYKLFAFANEQAELLAKGGFERVTDYGAVIEECLQQLRKGGHLSADEKPDAVGFKTVLGKNLSGCRDADQSVLDALDGFADIAPAHNPAYANGIRMFVQKMPDVPLVALFETAFYQWAPQAGQRYAVPQAWQQAGIQRYGFHGASHKFIAERTAELAGRTELAEGVRKLYQAGPPAPEQNPLRVVSCHLGGSSSITGIMNGVAIGTSMGLSPQSGLPQNNRVGDLDSMAIPLACKALGISVEEAQQQLNTEGGLLGLSGGVSNDMRDLKEAADKGNQDAQLALDVLLHSIRHWAGAFVMQMDGLDTIAFTGGIGENNPQLREAVCSNMKHLGVRLDSTKNNETRGSEAIISADDSAVQVVVIPANEELVVARETLRHIQNK